MKALPQVCVRPLKPGMPSAAARGSSVAGPRCIPRRRMLSETLQELGLARRPLVPARRVAELSRSASPAGPHFPDDLETGALPPLAPTAAVPPGAISPVPAAGGDIDPQGLAALTNGRLGSSSSGAAAAAAAAAAGGAQSGSETGGSDAAEALISQIARQQLELAFRQTHSGEEAASDAVPKARHPLALESLDDARPPTSAAPGRAQLVRRAAAAAGGNHSTEWPSSHHSQQQHQQQHQIAPSEATDTEQVLQPLIPARGGPDGASSSPAAAAAAAAPPGGIPRSIVVLSCVSMALTSASCVFNTLLPIYMVAELKLTMRSLGMFEGVLEAFSYVVRMFSGVLSDRMASRKAAIAAGFAMGAAAKCGMSFATTIGQLFIGKAIDRLGNGVQAAPRDALIGDLSPPTSRSACFGFAQAMRKWGSFMGAGLVFALMKATDNNYQAIFLGAAGVSALATLAFVAFVPSHPSSSQQQQQKGHPQDKGQQQQQRKDAGSFTQQARALWRDVRGMGSDFYRTLSVIGLYGLGHINESLLEARAIEVGFGKAEATLVVALLCLSVSFCAYPLGRLDDKYGPRTTFALGMAALVAGDLVLLASGAWPPAVFVACIFWGVHWAVVQGPMLGVVVSLAPPHLKGTAFGIFYSLMAVTAMVANTVFGSIWHTHGASAAFGLSAAVISATALFALPRLLPPRRGGMAAAPAAA